MLQDLAAEALSNVTDGEQDIEKQIEEALACPCIGQCHHLIRQIPCSRRFQLVVFHGLNSLHIAADLREGPCGATFVHAFSCYIRSDPQDGLEKGMDCIDQFKLFQECLKANPQHVEKLMGDAEEVVSRAEEEQQQQQQQEQKQTATSNVASQQDTVDSSHLNRAAT
jgi:hypothetical protein